MELEYKLTLKLTHSHPFFKHPKFVHLNSLEKNIYLSYKTDNYYVLNNQYTDPNGHSQISIPYNISRSDYQNNVHKIFKDSSFTIYFQKTYPFSENIKKILKNKELEAKFQSWTVCDIQEMFDSLKEEAKEKKRQEANKIKTQKEEEKSRLEQEKITIQKKKEKEMEIENNKRKELNNDLLELGLDIEDLL